MSFEALKATCADGQRLIDKLIKEGKIHAEALNPLLQVTFSQSLKIIHVQRYKNPWTIGHFLLPRGLISSFFSYLKYLLSNPAKACPCLASSLHISCTVSWIAS